MYWGDFLDFDLNKLTETMQRKTSKIIELKGECDIQKYKFIRIGFLSLIPLIYILQFSQRIFNYLLLIFRENIKIDPIMEKFDIIIVLIFITCSILFYKYCSKYITTRKQFESLRIDIIGNITKELCICKKDCNCDDGYIKYMDEHEIDVVFN